MHIQVVGNQEASIYNDTMEALGLIQHLLEPAHKLGNTLDVIYLESLETIKVLHTNHRSQNSWN